MDWILSGTSVLAIWLMGNKSIYGPIIGLFSQFLWFYYIFSTDQYGLFLGVFAYTIVHIRNLIRWYKEGKDKK